MTEIRAARVEDQQAIWTILEPVIRAGETYAFATDWSKEDALAYWCGSDKWCFVAEENGEILGTYYLRTNQAGNGSHVCNCGYMTATNAQGRGVARQMCEHSMAFAVEHGFRAMQFNFVVSNNTGAIALWQKLGFDIVGTLPKAFNHPNAGEVDAHIMYQRLVSESS